VSTSVGYSMTHACRTCGESGPTRWVEVRHGEDEQVGMCMQCRGVGEQIYSDSVSHPNESKPFGNQALRTETHEEHSKKYSEPLEPRVECRGLTPRKTITCQVHPGRCTRPDGHHGEHTGKDGARWNYGHCAIDPLMRDCPACRADEFAFDSGSTREPTVQRVRRAPEQMSLFQ
jgi:hypothetical protein